MGKINLKLPDIPITGKQVSFTAPCACKDTTGLVINNVDYVICDAIGTDLAGTDAWVSGAVVSIILNVEDAKAYVQNPGAPTRAEVKEMIDAIEIIPTITVDTPYELNNIKLTKLLPSGSGTGKFKIKFTNNISSSCGIILPIVDYSTTTGYVTLKEAEITISSQKGVVSNSLYSVYFEINYFGEICKSEYVYDVSTGLPYTDNQFGTTDWRFETASKNNTKLLWTNSSPSSSYAGFGNVSLDLSEYSFIIVWFRLYTSDDNAQHTCSMAPVGIGSGSSSDDILNATTCFATINKKWVRRYYYALPSKVVFGNGGYQTNVDSGYNIDNKYLIPERIYGIRK